MVRAIHASLPYSAGTVPASPKGSRYIGLVREGAAEFDIVVGAARPAGPTRSRNGRRSSRASRRSWRRSDSTNRR